MFLCLIISGVITGLINIIFNNNNVQKLGSIVTMFINELYYDVVIISIILILLYIVDKEVYILLSPKHTIKMGGL